MEGELDLHTVALTSLTYEARHLVTCLLNTSKILLSDGPDKLPRDWRGLASLVNISSEIANSYEQDKASKVLDHWIRKHDDTATIGKLLEFVQRIDRYDIFDDFMEMMERGCLIINQQQPIVNNQVAIPGEHALAIPEEDDYEQEQITFDDKIHGSPQFYHAYILYAVEDRDFVDLMLVKMRERGFRLCTENDLLPDHTTVYAPVSRLISSERCNRIILIYSPDFLTSPANTFYMDYAQAVGIEMKRPKIVPVMFRECQLPPQVTFYHKLYFNPPGSKSSYDFWERLGYALTVHISLPRLNGTTSAYSSRNLSSSYSTLNITEISMTNPAYLNGTSSSSPGISPFLALPAPSARSISMNGIDHIPNGEAADSSSLSGRSQTSEGRRKRNKFKTFFSQLLSKRSTKNEEVEGE